MKYDLLIKNGHVYAPQNLGVLDVAVAGGKIATLGSFLEQEAGEVVDATGKLVFPGLIETHAHMLLPLANAVTKNDFYSGTVAGAFGGVTTLIDFADQKKGRPPLEAIEKRMAQASEKAVVDYSFHCTLTDINTETIRQMAEIVELGITSFKFYTIYKDDGLYVDDGEMLLAFEKVAELGALVTVHAENEAIVRRQTEELKSKGMVSPGYYPLSKPAISEVEAIRRVLLLAGETCVPVLFRHVSSAGGVRAIKEARSLGQEVYGETCPHYLTLTNDVYQRADGRNYIVHPPIRENKDLNGLWEGIIEGHIAVIGTDDCAFTKEQKMFSDLFYEIPGGMPGIETRLAVMYHEGVNKGRISIEKLVEITSTNVAKIYDLYPQKGVIQVGSDADLVVFDPAREVEICSDNLHDMADWSPFEGWKVQGSVVVTVSKGKIIVRDNEFLGKAGAGSFLARKPS